MGGGGSIQDMNNRIRDNRAMLGRGKPRLKTGRRFFDKKPSMLVNKGTSGILKRTSESQLDEIRLKLRREARFNQVVAVFMFVVCIVVLAWLVYKIMT